MSKVPSTCQYDNCNLPIHPHDGKFCLGHAPLENKKVTVDEFSVFLRTYKINNHDANFVGFIFFGNPNLFGHNSPFNNEVVFNKCEFYLNDKLSEDEDISEISVFKLANVPFRSTLEFSECTFYGNVEISSCSIKEKFILNNVDIKGSFELKYNTFAQQVQAEHLKVDLHTNLITNSIVDRCFFRNSRFLKELKMSQMTFSNILELQYCLFNDKVLFDNVKFLKLLTIQQSKFNDEVSFKDTEMQVFATWMNLNFKEKVLFERMIFNSDWYVTNSKFEKEIIFDNETFNKKLEFTSCELTNARFIKSTFMDYTNFSGSSFIQSVDFKDAKFNNDVSFNDAKFQGSDKSDIVEFDFTNVVFKQKTEFGGNKIQGIINFYNLQITDRTLFILEDTEFASHGVVLFQNVLFRPLITYFENISAPLSNKRPLIIFRYCNLANTYFTNNDLSYFSFYKSAFDEARFISNHWNNVEEGILKRKWFFKFLKFKREKLIFEDIFYDEFRSLSGKSLHTITNLYQLQDLTSHGEISNLYRRFKTALDKTKDYEQAGWFYFNEFEMRRREVYSESTPKYILFTLYKIFAGYGEKPLWSTAWLGILFILFSILNIFSGVVINGEQIINYDLTWSLKVPPDLLPDYGKLLLFTLYRILPVGYLPFPKEQFLPMGADGYLIAFLNTGILILFITFIAVGLKRIFRRF